MTTTVYRTRADFDAAVTAAQAAAASYYHTDVLHMTDADYDTLIDTIAATVVEHPGWDARGLLDQVAAGTTTSGTVTHPTPMLSLGKVTEPADLTAFLARLGNAATVTEPKLDGVAIRAVYAAGALTAVITRGDGTAGEDITGQALQVTGLPATLASPVDIEVRGEVYMTDEDFQTASANRVAAGKDPFANPRNAAAGTLRNPDIGYDAPLSFAAYDATAPHLPCTHTARMTALAALRITTAVSLIPAGIDPLAAPQTVVEALGAARDTLAFPIDGVVIKADADADRDRLGNASREPRWAIAWKYPPAEAASVLRDIEVTIGRTGRLALTAIIDPVHVAGVTVTRATLHNVAFVTEQGFGIGSPVIVVRAGDVIPRVTAALGTPSSDITAWQPPQTCPQCDQPWDTSSVLWRCHTASCSLVGWITYFASRDVMDIDGLGETVAVALVETDLIRDPADLYTLTVEDLTSLPLAEGRKLGEKNAEKIRAEIDKSTGQNLARVITSLGIRGTGRSVGRWLAREFGTMDALRAATVTQIAAIEGLGPVKAQLIVDGLAARAETIDRLAAAGVTMSTGTPTNSSATAAPLAGMTVVVTGAMTGPLAHLTRTEMNEFIESHGGKASGSVSAKTSLLVCGEPGSSKYAKALSLGVRILTPEEFATLVG